MSKTIGIVGTGLIGASWAALFLANGHKVIATDPAEGAETRLREFIDNVWPALESLGLKDGANKSSNLSFVQTPEEAVREADFIQESGPERTELKCALIARIDAAAPPNSPIASSSSGLPASTFIADCNVRAERVLIGHPFNPPHLIPLVEVVPHAQTEESIIYAVKDFYNSLSKKPIVLRKEAPGFVANRLQSALLREAMSIVLQGIATPEDIDVAVSNGPGLRWGFLGPFLQFPLAAAGGFPAAIDHLGAPFQSWWDESRAYQEQPVDLRDEKVKAKLKEHSQRWISQLNIPEVVKGRDELLIQLVKNKLEKGIP